MKAVIMAGGEGTRLRPLTCNRPKPMVPVANRPVMAYAVELLRRHGWRDIAVTLQYLPRAITDHFGQGEDYGVRLRYFLERTPLGTAGSVKNAASFLDETFIVVSGDALTDFPLDQAVEFHRRRGAIATLVLTSVENPLEYGVVITDADGRIRRFLEKPGWGEVFSDRVNTGIYVLEPDVLQFIPDGRPFDFSKDLFPLLLRQGLPLYGCLLKGFWCDIGNIAEYRRAHQEVLAGRVAADLPGEERSEGIRIGKDTTIDPRASLRGPALIGSNCRLEAGVTVEPYTVIGDNVVVEEGASLKQAIVWEGSVIGRRAAVRRAVLGQGVVLEDNTAVYEGAAVGDGCTVRSFSIVKPEVKIWPAKEIDKYTTVKENLVWGSRCPRSLFASRGVGGHLHRELTPAVVSQVANAFAGLLAPKSSVALSYAPGAGPRLLASAAMAGLMSGGLRVFALGETLLPVHRYAVRAMGLAGGLHVRRDEREEDRFWLVFTDGRGLPLAGGQRRKMDGAYQQGDFRRVKEKDLASVEEVPGLEERYLAYLGDSLSTAVHRVRAPFVVYSPSPKVFSFLLRLAPYLPWEPVPAGDLNSIRREIKERAAAGGVAFDAEGERLLLWHADGQPVSRQALSLLLTRVILADPAVKVLALPVTASGHARALAEEVGVEVRWVRNDWRAVAEAAWQGPLGGRQVQMLGDALFTLVVLAGYLAEQDLTLSQALAALPQVWQKAKDVPCPWSAKGKVLRELAEEESSRRLELIDGLKVYHEEGWALLLPDADEPFYHVYSEATSPARAEDLCRQYADKIGRLVQNAAPPNNR